MRHSVAVLQTNENQLSQIPSAGQEESIKQEPQRHGRGILISSEVKQPPTFPRGTSHTELFRHRSAVFVCHLACHPTAASSPPPSSLVGVNEQQDPSNCLCLTQLTESQRKKQMRRKRATHNKKPSKKLNLCSELTGFLAEEDECCCFSDLCNLRFEHSCSQISITT